LGEAVSALEQLRARLISVPANVADTVVQGLPKEVVYCNSWREFGSSGDFDNLSDWLVYAASREGAQASISRFISVDELERLGPNIVNVVLDLANAAAPLFRHCYPVQPEQQMGLDDDAVNTGDTGEAINVGESEAQELPSARSALLAGAAADTVPEPGDGRVRAADRLGIATDVEMLVSVLLATDTPLPLAVGLFGDWGSGKSFFMALMQERIAELSKLAAEGKPEAWPFCREVRQVKFNAWHYVDANLWASLAATLFDELALQDTPREKLLQELDEARKDAKDARDNRQAREKEVAELAAKADRPAAVIRVSAPMAIHAVRNDDLVSNLRSIRAGTTPEDRKEQLIRTEQLVDALGEIDSAAGTAKTAWRLFEEEILHRRSWATLITLVVFVGAAILASVAVSVPAGLKILTLIGAVVVGLTPALRGAVQVLYLAREAREARELPLAQKRDELAQAQAREEAADQKVGQYEHELADLQDKGLQLQEFVRKRAASSDYRGKLGVISQIRRDFEELVALLPGSQPTAPEQSAVVVETVKEHIPEVERIVLFIDDLDRCPHDKVVEVLQAVHLLLAFKLFVVVVGVDSQWLERSLRQHYKNLLEEPTSYLEKIFQVPFTLRRMTLDCYQDLIEGLTVPPKRPSEHSDEVPGHRDPTFTGPTQLLANEDDDEDDSTGFNSAPTKLPPVPRPEALVISSDERELLGKVGALVPTPRTAKRLVNIYRMLRVSVPDSELEAFLPSGGNEYQAVVLLLGVLIGRPSRAHEVFQKLEGATDADDLWKVLAEFTDICEPLKPIHDDIKVTQAGPYRRWVPRVARFSFRLSDIRPKDEEFTGTRPEN
jgi:KAP family P-loop domain